jgi:hypothetical protein
MPARSLRSMPIGKATSIVFAQAVRDLVRLENVLRVFVEREELHAADSFTNPNDVLGWQAQWRAADREGFDLVQQANKLLKRQTPRRRPR